jgi:hypothetical protein
LTLRLPLAVAAGLVLTMASSLENTGFRSPAPESESAGWCPVTLRVAHHDFDPLNSLPSDTASTFTNSDHWPGTVVQTTEGPGAYVALMNGDAEVALISSPLTGSQLDGKYQYQAGASAWVVVQNRENRPRTMGGTGGSDDSAQVRGDDWLNFVPDDLYGWLNAHGYTAVYPALRPIPDWDVNLDGTTSLGDLGAIAARWGQESFCRGWIRADANNNGTVSLGDIGTVTNRWGKAGLLCDGTTGCPLKLFKDRLGEYSHRLANCLDDGVDPITMIIRMSGNQIEGHLAHHGLPYSGGASQQYFWSNGSCAANEIDQRSSGEGLCWRVGCPTARWHVRGHKNPLMDPQYGGLNNYALTPHYDEVVGCGHAVPEDFFEDGSNWSGFSEARERTTIAWLDSGHHMMVASERFENTDAMIQCDGSLARGDGYVYMLSQCGNIPSIPC